MTDSFCCLTSETLAFGIDCFLNRMKPDRHPAATTMKSTKWIVPLSLFLSDYFNYNAPADFSSHLRIFRESSLCLFVCQMLFFVKEPSGKREAHSCADAEKSDHSRHEL